MLVDWPLQNQNKSLKCLEENQLVCSIEEVSDEFCQIQNENENSNGRDGIPVIENLQEFLVSI